jgi:hypothetical protein
MTAFTPRLKGYFMRNSTVVFVLKGGKYLPRYFKFSPLPKSKYVIWPDENELIYNVYRSRSSNGTAAPSNLIYNVYRRSSNRTAALSNLIIYNVHRRSSYGTAAQSNIVYHVRCRSSYGTALQSNLIYNVHRRSSYGTAAQSYLICSIIGFRLRDFRHQGCQWGARAHTRPDSTGRAIDRARKYQTLERR